jgi:glycosyltransferase involved in cell wall biosynthesis
MVEPRVPDQVVLMLSHVRPTLGLEKCALRLINELPSILSVVCIGEDLDVLRASIPRGQVECECLGEPVRGWRRLRSLPALRAWSRRNSRTVVVTGVWAAIPLLLVRGRGSFDVIVWEHSLSTANIAASRGLRLLALLVPILYRRVKCVVAVSDELARDLASLTHHPNIQVIPNYLPVISGRSDRASEQAGTYTMLTVGSLSAIKNQQILVRAMAQLPTSFRLLVAGDGPLRDELVSLADDVGVTDRIEWLGHVVDMVPAYSAADVVVQPSLGETFGMVMFEAASIDLPVVTLDYPHSRSLVPQAIVGEVCAPDPSSLAEAVRHTHATPPKPASYAAARRERRVRFGDETITSSWLQILSTGRVA